MRIRALICGLAALLGASCDDAHKVTRVEPADPALPPMIRTTNPIPVEVIGTPFEGVTDGELAARLNLPGNYPRGIRFAPLEGGRPRGLRLVLAFNLGGMPPDLLTCRETERLTPGAPREQGFSVFAAFCRDGARMGSGWLDSNGTRADDPEDFAQAMALLLNLITKPRRD